MSQRWLIIGVPASGPVCDGHRPPRQCISFANGASCVDAIVEAPRSVLALAADCGEPDPGPLLVAIAAERMGRDCRAGDAFSSALGQLCC